MGRKYGYRSRADYELRAGGASRAYATEDMRAMGGPEVIIEGKVLEADPPRKLVQTWTRSSMRRSRANRLHA